MPKIAAVMKFANDPDQFPHALQRSRRIEPAVEDDAIRRRRSIQLGCRAPPIIKEPPFFEGVTRAAAQNRRHQGRARVGIVRRLDHHRSHQPVDQDQGRLARRQIPARAQRQTRRLQQSSACAAAITKSWCAAPSPTCASETWWRPAPRARSPIHQPTATQMTIFEASERYHAEGVPLVVFGGEEYGIGSSRDWAAKGVQLLGVKAVIVNSFERIHRANLDRHGRAAAAVQGRHHVQALKIDGTETFDVEGINGGDVKPMQDVTLVITPQRRREAARAAHVARRHRHRGRLPAARRHPAVRVAPDLLAA